MTASLSLVRVPTDDDLARAYHELSKRGIEVVGRRVRWPYAPATDEALLVLLSEMARYDARLLGALIALGLRAWQRLSPVLLRQAMASVRCPQATCVVVEFMRSASRDRELAYWAAHVTAGWPRQDPAVHFFVDDVRPGERMAAGRQGRSLTPYSRWGFLAVERPTIDPHRKRVVGRYDARTRRAALAGLVERAPTGVTLQEYLDAIDHSISRQQALLDLHALGLVTKGRGPGARWRPRRVRRAR